MNSAGNNDLARLVHLLQISQQQLAVAISVGDTVQVDQLLEEREPQWQELSSWLEDPERLSTGARGQLSHLMESEQSLQKQLQQAMLQVNGQLRDLGGRSRLLQRYRWQVKPKPRFLDRNG